MSSLRELSLCEQECVSGGAKSVMTSDVQWLASDNDSGGWRGHGGGGGGAGSSGDMDYIVITGSSNGANSSFFDHYDVWLWGNGNLGWNDTGAESTPDYGTEPLPETLNVVVVGKSDSTSPIAGISAAFESILENIGNLFSGSGDAAAELGNYYNVGTAEPDLASAIYSRFIGGDPTENHGSCGRNFSAYWEGRIPYAPCHDR